MKHNTKFNLKWTHKSIFNVYAISLMLLFGAACAQKTLSPEQSPIRTVEGKVYLKNLKKQTMQSAKIQFFYMDESKQASLKNESMPLVLRAEITAILGVSVATAIVENTNWILLNHQDKKWRQGQKQNLYLMPQLSVQPTWLLGMFYSKIKSTWNCQTSGAADSGTVIQADESCRLNQVVTYTNKLKDPTQVKSGFMSHFVSADFELIFDLEKDELASAKVQENKEFFAFKAPESYKKIELLK